MARAQPRAYKVRANKVIDQGSLAQPPDDLLAARLGCVLKLFPPDGDAPAKKPVQTTWRCCQCSRCCPDFFRGTFCAAGLLEASLNETREEAAVTIPLISKRKSCATTMSRSGASARSPVRCISFTKPWPGSWPRLACRAMDSRQGRRKPIPICHSSARRSRSSRR